MHIRAILAQAIVDEKFSSSQVLSAISPADGDSQRAGGESKMDMLEFSEREGGAYSMTILPQGRMVIRLPSDFFSAPNPTPF